MEENYCNDSIILPWVIHLVVLIIVDIMWKLCYGTSHIFYFLKDVNKILFFLFYIILTKIIFNADIYTIQLKICG